MLRKSLSPLHLQVRSSALSIWLQGYSSSLSGDSVHHRSCVSAYGNLLLSIANQVCEDVETSSSSSSPSSSSSLACVTIDKGNKDDVKSEDNISKSFFSVLCLLEKSFNHKFTFIDPIAASRSLTSPTSSSSSSSSSDSDDNVAQKGYESDDSLLNLVLLSQVLLACAVQNDQHKQAHIEAILAADEDVQTELMTMIEEVLAEIESPSSSSSSLSSSSLIDSVVFDQKEGGKVLTASSAKAVSTSSSSSSSFLSSSSLSPTISNSASKARQSESLSMKTRMSPQEERLLSISSSLIIRRRSTMMMTALTSTAASLPLQPTSSPHLPPPPPSSSSSSTSLNESEAASFKRGRGSIMSPQKASNTISNNEEVTTSSSSLTPAAKLFRASSSDDDVNSPFINDIKRDERAAPLPVIPTTGSTTAMNLHDHVESSSSSSSSSLSSLSSTLSALTALQVENQHLRMQLEQHQLTHQNKQLDNDDDDDDQASSGTMMMTMKGKPKKMESGRGGGHHRSAKPARESLVGGDDILSFLQEISSSSSSSNPDLRTKSSSSEDDTVSHEEELLSTRVKLAAAEARVSELLLVTSSKDPSSSSSSSSSNNDAMIIAKLREECDILRPAVSRAEKSEALVEKLKKRLEALSDVKETLLKTESHAADLTSRLIIAEKEAAKVAPLRVSIEEAKEKLCIAEVKCSELSSLLAEAQSARDELQSAFDCNASAVMGMTNLHHQYPSAATSSSTSVDSGSMNPSSTTTNSDDFKNEDDGVSAARAMIAASGGLNYLLSFANPGRGSGATSSDDGSSSSQSQQLSTDQAERLARLEDERAEMLASRSSVETTQQIAKLENDISDLRRIKAAFEMRLSSALGRVSECERVIKLGETREAEKDEKILKLERELNSAMASLVETKSRLEASIAAERDVCITLEEERSSRTAEKALASRRHAALSSELSTAHADHCIAIDEVKRDADSRAQHASSALETLRSQLKAVSDDAVLREEALKMSFERSTKNEVEALKRMHTIELLDVQARCKEFEDTIATLTASVSSLEVQKEKGLAYVSNLQAALRARDVDIQSLRDEAENELEVMDGQITAAKADAEAALSRLTLMESRLVEARREADMYRSKSERQARHISELEQQQRNGGGGGGGGVSGSSVMMTGDNLLLPLHASLESVDAYLKLLSVEIDSLRDEREKVGSLLESLVHFIGTRTGLALPKIILDEFEKDGLFRGGEEEEEEVEEEKEEDEEKEEGLGLVETLTLTSDVVVASSSSSTGGGGAQRVKIDAGENEEDESSLQDKRRTRKSSKSSKTSMRDKFTVSSQKGVKMKTIKMKRRGGVDGDRESKYDDDDDDDEDDENTLSVNEGAQVVSQSLLRLAEMRNVIASKEISLATLKRREAESSFSRISLEMQCSKLADTVTDLEAKLTRASLLHQRLMKALSDADIHVLGSDTSFNIVQDDDERGGEEEEVMMEDNNVENRQAFKLRNKMASSSSSSASITSTVHDIDDEFVPASSVFSTVYAPAPRRKEAE